MIQADKEPRRSFLGKLAAVTGLPTLNQLNRITEAISPSEGFLDPTEFEANAAQIASFYPETNMDSRINALVAYCDEKFEKSPKPIGLQWEEKGIALPPGKYLVYTNLKDNSIQKAPEQVLDLTKPIKDFKTGGYGFNLATQLNYPTARLFVPTPGRAIRLAPEMLRNEGLFYAYRYYLDINLHTIINSYADKKERITAAIARVNEIFGTDPRVRESGRLWNSSIDLPEGEWLFWTNLLDKEPLSSHPYLNAVQPIEELADGGWGLRRASIVKDGSVHIPTPGRAIYLGGPAKDSKKLFLPQITT